MPGPAIFSFSNGECGLSLFQRPKLTLLLIVLLFIPCLSCHRSGSPEESYERARKTFVQGNLVASQREAELGYNRFSHSAPDWAWRFKLLEAESLLWQGKYRDVLTLLRPAAVNSAPQSLHVSILSIQAVALARQNDIASSLQKLEETERLCASPESEGCGEAFQARGLLALGQNQFEDARQEFKRSLSAARLKGDKFLEATALLNLGGLLVKQGKFDETIDNSNAAYEAGVALGASDIVLAAQENMAWSYYRLGDSARALSLLLETEQRAAQLGDTFGEENALTDIGYVYMDESRFGSAKQVFLQALTLSQKDNRKEHMLNALRVLARLGILTDDPESASEYAEQALNIARETQNHLDELYPQLVLGQAAERRGDSEKAQQIFEAINRDHVCPVFLKWQAEHSLARLYEDERRQNLAEHEYRSALSTFESARASVTHEDFQLSFLTNGAGLYDDYIDFLISQHKPDLALRWADFSRARALAEGLGMLRSEKRSATDAYITAPPLDPQAIARRAQGALLFYWLGEKQSYLWAITSRKSQLFPLPARNEIEALVKRYRAALTGPQNVLESGGEDGQVLYRMLIAPAQSLLAANERVFILPDGALNNLNFETLIVSAPKSHFWIEDADIVNASSLRVLDASLARPASKSRDLLLIGNSVAPSKDYPELPKAADQMASVAHHFSSAAERVYEREQATPVSYLQSNLQQFSYIHFVAHGTASRLSPLDSAIVLSKNPGNPESFKLYARDIIHHPLHAELVTISACYGAGERQYSGEGLVGLAWAFLRAGARNVIAALWEVTDVSTGQLMDYFYEELSKGAPPDVALRNAKLSLLHGSAFHSPFYWAPFQLYRG